MAITGASPARLTRTRRDRRAQERTRAQLERMAGLEAQARDQGAVRLGPAGRPMGEAALASWTRAQATAYLALPPWRRAWLTWQSWGVARRALAMIAAACAWTVVVLPFRMLGLATLETSQIGVAVLVALAPVAALAPPWRRGRFEREVHPGPPWRSSRAGVRLRRLLAVGALAAAVAIGLAMWLGGVRGPDPGPVTAAGERANARVVERVIADACGAPVPVEVAREGRDTFRATLPGGASALVRVEFSGRSPFGSGSGHGELLGPAPACPRPPAAAGGAG